MTYIVRQQTVGGRVGGGLMGGKGGGAGGRKVCFPLRGVSLLSALTITNRSF